MAAAFSRCGGYCEGCGARLAVGKFEYDHRLPDILGGEPTLENCQVLCSPCHAEKTAGDIKRTRKADRQRDKHIGAMPRSRQPLPGGRRSPWKRKISGEVVPR